jgi:hypothetical protein
MTFNFIPFHFLPAHPPSLPKTFIDVKVSQPSQREEKEWYHRSLRNKRLPRNAPQMNPAKEERRKKKILSSHATAMLMLMHTSALKCIFKRTIYAIVPLALTHSAPLVHVDYSALLSCHGP